MAARIHPRHQVSHGRGMPGSASRRADSGGIQRIGNLLQRAGAVCANFLDDGKEFVGMQVRAFPDGRYRGVVSLAGALKGSRALGIAKLHAAAFRLGQRFLGAPACGLALMLRQQRQDAYRQRIGVGHVGSDEQHAAVPEREQEIRIARQAIYSRDDKRRFDPFAFTNGFLQLRPGSRFSGFRFGEFAQQRSGLGRDEIRYRLALGVDVESGSPFAFGAGSIVSDEFPHHDVHESPPNADYKN
ncbi:MAG TPA: hypothetical protein VHB46_06800 [Burkholderiales bacterium]|nr:hypothetical protein [Burkholderiales bacterium]